MTIPRYNDPLTRRRERVRVPARSVQTEKLAEPGTDAESLQGAELDTVRSEGQAIVFRGGRHVYETPSPPATEGGAPGTHAAQHARGGEDDLVDQIINVLSIEIEDSDATPTSSGIVLRVRDGELQLRNSGETLPMPMSVSEYIMRNIVGGNIVARFRPGTTGSDIVDIIDGAGTSRAHLRQDRSEFWNLRTAGAQELTIASGAVTRTRFYHTIDTEGDAASDDLDTINGGSACDLLLIRPVNDARTVVVKHLTGNIRLNGDADLSLDEEDDCLLLLFDNVLGDWIEISRNVASAGAGGGHTIEENGTPLTARTVLNFQDGVIASDDGSETDVNLDYGGTGEIADVGPTEAAGASNKVPRADHVHAHTAAHHTALALYSVVEYVFTPDEAPDADIDAGVQSMYLMSGPAAEIPSIMWGHVATAAGTALTFTIDYGDTNDLDTVATWTAIGTVAMASSLSQSQGALIGSIPADKLLRLNITTSSGTPLPRGLTAILKCKRPLST